MLSYDRMWIIQGSYMLAYGPYSALSHVVRPYSRDICDFVPDIHIYREIIRICKHGHEDNHTCVSVWSPCHQRCSVTSHKPSRVLKPTTDDVFLYHVHIGMHCHSWAISDRRWFVHVHICTYHEWWIMIWRAFNDTCTIHQTCSYARRYCLHKAVMWVRMNTHRETA